VDASKAPLMDTGNSLNKNGYSNVENYLNELAGDAGDKGLAK
jgi:hypothetical protein